MIEGDLLRLAGDLGGAETAYERATEFGRDPQPGLALLRLAQDRLDVADPMTRRVLGECEDPMSRARILPAYVEIVLATGDVDAGRGAAEELRDVATEIGTPFLRAQAARAAGTVRLADGDAAAALVDLRRAFNDFQTLGVRHEAARTRLLIADACERLGDHDAARMETSAAYSTFDALGAPSPTASSSVSGPLPDGLTARELEVLTLLARGKTNRVIAQELFISEKTVASHVSHIFTKLGVGSRSAATAYAYDHDLV